MTTPHLDVRDLVKTYRVRARPAADAGLGARVRHAFRPRTTDVTAVAGLTFAVAPGERVAFVGPNGAGKSTTIKMLSGILAPTSGTARVLGLTPTTDRKRLGYAIGTVFGQRSQLWYHLPAGDSFDLLARIYDLERPDYLRRRAELTERFGLGPLLVKPVRQLSLGERMRCEIAASLLHRPKILFLDEPTIGLDVTAKAQVRELVRERSLADGSTVLLTSHDMGDVERVTDRIVVINGGRLVLDEPLKTLKRDYLKRKFVTVKTDEPEITVDAPGVEVVARQPHEVRLAVDTARVKLADLVQGLTQRAGLRDLTVEDPPMEEIIRRIYDAAPAPPAGERG